MKRDVDLNVKCDKPYDLDAADKRRGRPKRRRKDSHSTAYELTIRLNEAQREVMDGKRKFVRVVYALNKKSDLARQAAEFEQDVSRKIEAAAVAKGCKVEGQRPTVTRVIESYLASRDQVTVSSYAKEGRDLMERYVVPTIGSNVFDELTVVDIQKALDAIPEISRTLNEAKREREMASRKRRGDLIAAGELPYRPQYPDFKPVRVAGMPTKHRVLSLLRDAGNYGLEMGLVTANAASSRRLAKSYPRNKPLIDNWTEDEARKIHDGIEALPLSCGKVEFQLMLMCGLRPCEVLRLTFDDITVRDGGAWLHVVKRTKTANSRRAIPLDPETASILAEWKTSRMDLARGNGIVFSNTWLVCCEDGQKTAKSTLRARWGKFLGDLGIEYRRPYSLRHTFATMNARLNVDAKTLSVLMGHANAGFTYQVYAGYLESAALPVTTNYLGFLSEEGAEGETS